MRTFRAMPDIDCHDHGNGNGMQAISCERVDVQQAA
ncbi:hypothetical protein WDL1CHR_02245 [Variovorax sp. WDL1]|nr:hypothetical protein CHC06_04684 [Variovorax sp. B2]PNG53909.1 hypothetical protein CHC07_03731 [Variovorax sp. B4]VTV11375.1 hypothetical protein WDL1CHR_02245 [Variovorax sp. WDL1]